MSQSAQPRLIATKLATRRYVALYCRISDDPSGRSEGVDIQEEYGRAYAAKTWPGIEIVVFCDDDLDASRDDTYRPRYEALRQALARKEVIAVWCKEQSRLERREKHWFGLVEELETAGIEYLHTRQEGVRHIWDLGTGVTALVNAEEIRRIKKRTRDRIAAEARRGIPHGGRPFGYKLGFNDRGERTYHIVPEEADIIRECYKRVMNGWSENNIATDLNARGIVGPHRRRVKDTNKNVLTIDNVPLRDGGIPITRVSPITANSIRHWLVKSRAVVGIRVHHGVEYPGNWTAILTMDEWDRARSKLAAPREVTGKDGKPYTVTGVERVPARTYLLTGGMAVCGVCGERLKASQKITGGKRRADGTFRPGKRSARYMCGATHCVSMKAEPFEEHVVQELFKALDSPEFAAAAAEVDTAAPRRAEILEAIAEVDKRKRANMRRFQRLEIDDQEWEEAKAAAAEVRAELLAEYDALPLPPDSEVFTSAKRLPIMWNVMTLDERRKALSLHVARAVLVRGSQTEDHKVDLSRISVEWRWAS